MMPEVEITAWHYAGFLFAVLCLLALDLGFFHRKSHTVTFKEALGWTAFWFILAMFFAWGFVMPEVGHDSALNFVLGYLIELSLSMDNVMVIAVIFTYFKVAPQYQHRVLFWGIIGALIMRGIIILLGVELIHAFAWLLYLLGGFLVFTGIKMVFNAEQEVEPEHNPLIRITKKFYPIATDYDGHRFTTIVDARRALTPLALVLLMVETTDLIFAVDSIPAIFAITLDPFIIFTSNVFAILGLRSLYFVLAGAIDYFRFLKFGLSVVLVFIGAKMLMAKVYHVPTPFSLLIVGSLLAISIIASVVVAWRENKNGGKSCKD